MLSTVFGPAQAALFLGCYMRLSVSSVTVLVAGMALLGLSGWFITSAGIAGLLGAGMTYDFFRPSAGIRFLALGRTAARWAIAIPLDGHSLGG